MRKYDVFISFKHTDNGVVTSDSHVAEQLFYARKDAGFRVFFSEAELSSTGESEYMAAIDTALQEARILIIVASEARFIQSGWVAQEWRSFVNLALKDPSRRLFSFLVGSMTMSDLPALLGPYQAFHFNEGIEPLVSYLSHATTPTQSQIEELDADPVRRLVRLGFGIGQRRDFRLACSYIESSPVKHPMLQAMLAESRFNAGGREKETAALIRELTEQHSVAGSYLAASAYRNGKLGVELSIARYKECLRAGKADWRRLIASSGNGGRDLLILSYSDSAEYLSASEYMCACILELLTLFDVGCAVREVSPDWYPDAAALEGWRYVLYASSSVNAFDGGTPEEAACLDLLCALPRNRMYLGLAGVRLSNISGRFRNRHCILNDQESIGNFCDHLIGQIKGDES